MSARHRENIDYDLYCAGLAIGYRNDTHPVISYVDEHSPALACGVIPGDRLLSINDELAAFMGVDEINDRLKSKTPRKITLELQKPGSNPRKVCFDLIQGKSFADNSLARRICSDRRHYPINDEPIKAGFYKIDLPTFCRQEASEGPLVLEFYKEKAARSVSSILADFNARLSNGNPHVSLISIALADGDTRPLREHFRIDQPSFVFISANEPDIKDFIDVIRHEISKDELEERLHEMIDLKDQSPNMIPLLYPKVAARWREITNRELQLMQKKP